MSDNSGAPVPKEGNPITLDKDTVYGAAVAVLACLLVVSVFTQGFGVIKSGTPAVLPSGNQSGVQKLSDAALKSKIESYLAQNLISPGYTAEVTKLEPYDRSTTIATLSIKQGGTELETAQVYITNDGSSLFLQGFRVNESLKQGNNSSPPASAGAKVDRPKAQAFIMSFCPYGLQFLKAYVPVMELLKDSADLEVRFVPYLMHGEKELAGNNYIYCVQKEDKPKLTSYLRCAVENGDYAGCVASAGIDGAKIDACVAATNVQYNLTAMFNDQSTWAGGRYPPYPVDGDLAGQYGVQGSPTFVLNGNEVSVARSAEAIKQAVCATFNQVPAACNTTLRSQEEAPGTGPIGSGSAGAGSASCG